MLINNLLVLTSAIWLGLMNKEVAEPYMDEPFHVGQTRSYLAGNWSQWDEKITTPPGLYIVGVGWARLCEAAGFGESRDVPVLRALNTVFYALTAITISRLANSEKVAKVLTKKKPIAAQQPHVAAQILTFPFLFFYSAFYYTDLASIFSILVLMLQLCHNHALLPLVTSIWAVSLRQTNIVWVALCYCTVILHDAGVEDVLQLFQIDKVASLFKKIFFTRRVGVVAVVLGFASAAYVNGGIVLGDKSNHEAVFHPTQMVYLTALVAVFFPFLCFEGVVGIVKHRSAGKLFFVVCWGVASYVCLKWFCITHPFTLADNRHFTFYIWKRLQMQNEESLLRFLFIVPSCGGVLGVLQAFANTPKVLLLTLFLATCASLVPSPLFEPRYYLTPIVLLILVASVSRSISFPSSMLHIALHTFINVATVSLFLFKTFTAPDGTVGRFMW